MAAASSSAPDIPEEFVCVITQRLMRDAVVDHEGNSYDKAAIEAWLERDPTSPHTRAPLRKAQLAPNRVLRGLIDKWRAQTGYADTTEASAVAGASGSGGAAADAPRAASFSVGVKGTRDNTLYLQVRTPEAPCVQLAGTGAEVVKNRLPAVVVCSIDVSGSMCAMAKVKNDQGNEECNGLSQLDLVKHAIRTVISCLGEEDSLGLVDFHSNASVKLPIVKMTKANKERALAAVTALHTQGMTNLWDGIYKGLEELRSADVAGNANLMVFTDGCPTVEPPRGHLEMLQRYRDEHQTLPGSVNTYGFGYQLDSKLLDELATEGGGTYGFIPDASLLGTVFVNSISNQLAKCARDTIVNVEECEGFKLAKGPCVLGGYQHTRTSWGVTINVGSMQYGQTRDVVVLMADPADDAPLDRVQVSCFDLEKRERVPVAASPLAPGADKACPAEVHALRLRAVDAMREIHAAMKVPHGTAPGARPTPNGAVPQGVGDVLSAMLHDLTRLDCSPLLSDIHKDLDGQVREASARVAFDKWGKHFLPSLFGAHLAQQCNNFKDPGVQHYGGRTFKDLRDRCDAAFLKIPAPTPSKPPPSRGGGYGGFSGGAAAAPRAPVKMANYYNCSGGCFAGGCSVACVGGATRRVDEVAAGTQVATPTGAATVVCVVRTRVAGGKVELATFAESGLELTPYHPVRVAGGEWAFPIDLPEAVPKLAKTEYVYDFVLSAGHTVYVNGVACVTLGHGFTEKVVAHPYFGTQDVVDDLAALPGWTSGEVTIDPACFVRDAVSKLVVGYNA